MKKVRKFVRKLIRRNKTCPIALMRAKKLSESTQNQAFQTLKTHQNPQTLLSALADSFTFHGCSPTFKAYAFVANSLIRTSNISQIALLLDRIESSESFTTPEPFLARIIRAYGRSGLFRDAIGVFSRIPRFRCVPSTDSLDSLLFVLCKRDEGLRFVPEVLEMSRELGVRLRGSSFRILICTLVRIGGIGHAVELFKCMIKDYDFDLEPEVCSGILSGICEKREEIGLDGLGILRFFERLLCLNFSPRLIDFARVIKVLVQEKRGSEALGVLIKAKNCGIKPDIVCYNMVLSGLVEVREFEEVDKLFDELLVFGLVPNIHTYNAFIRGLCVRNDFEGGSEMICSMKELGCEPNVITYNLALKALCENGNVGRAKKIASDMTIAKNFLTYEILLEGVLREGNVVEGCALMDEMFENGLCGQSSTFDEIIFGLCRRGMVAKALEMLEKMVAKNLGPGEKAWESLLHGFRSEISSPDDLLMRVLIRKGSFR